MNKLVIITAVAVGLIVAVLFVWWGNRHTSVNTNNTTTTTNTVPTNTAIDTNDNLDEALEELELVDD